MHKQLWQGGEPVLLVPSANRNAKAEDKTNTLFVESTLPTSMVFAAICAQITQHRSAKKFRYAAMNLFYSIIKKLIRNNCLKARFVNPDGMEFSIPVPTSGAFPSATVISMIGEPGIISKIQTAWNKDSQDQCLTKQL